MTQTLVRRSISAARPLSLSAIFLLLVAAATPAFASTRGVVDNAKLFSDSAVQKANAVFDDVYNRHHAKEVLIETFNALPEGQTDPRKFAEAQREKYKLNGLYVLIVRKGGVVGVLPGNQMEKIFTKDVSASLRTLLVDGLRAGKDDQALIDAAQSIKGNVDLAERASTPAALPPPTRTAPPAQNPARNNACGAMPGGFMGIACMIIGAWLVIGLIRSVMNRGGGGYGGQGGPGYGGYGNQGYGGGGFGGGGGGGWGSSIMGGLFGAVAGSYIYDRFLGGSSSHAAPPSDPGYGGGYGGSAPTSSEPGWAAPDTSVNSDAGSFGSSGSDFGGSGGSTSDSGGGGFFGGGDSGGGGGDFGGGGGDFGGGGSD